MLSFVANSLCEKGHDISLVNFNAAPEYVNVAKRVINEKIAIYEEKSGKKKTAADKIWMVMNAAREQQAEVLVGFTEIPNVVAKIAGFLLGIPSVMSERGDPVRTGVGKGLKNWLVLQLINSSRGGVFQTEGAMNFYGKGLKKRGIIIPNPIFINEVIPQIKHSDRSKTIVSVGRFDNEQKRYDIMLEAFAIFSKKHPNYILKLYGKGNDEESIRDWIKERVLEDKVKLMGITAHPMQSIHKDGMFLITSDYEGISNALLEAMAVGLPCVSTDHSPGGARLLISDHENGLLAPTRDSYALALAMCEYAENDKLAQKCGENAKNVLERFAPERIVMQWETYLFGIINR